MFQLRALSVLGQSETQRTSANGSMRHRLLALPSHNTPLTPHNAHKAQDQAEGRRQDTPLPPAEAAGPALFSSSFFSTSLLEHTHPVRPSLPFPNALPLIASIVHCACPWRLPCHIYPLLSSTPPSHPPKRHQHTPCLPPLPPPGPRPLPPAPPLLRLPPTPHPSSPSASSTPTSTCSPSRLPSTPPTPPATLPSAPSSFPPLPPHTSTCP